MCVDLEPQFPRSDGPLGQRYLSCQCADSGNGGAAGLRRGEGIVKQLSGRAWVFSDDINTDLIHPPQFFSLDPEVVRRGLFSGLDPELQALLAPGDILVAGQNFGCGSSRETSIQSIKLNQIGAIVAVDFARIFFRSATNNALPCVNFADPADHARIRPGQEIELCFDEWTLCTDAGDRIDLEPVGSFVRAVWEAGGLLQLLGAGSST
jgi:3-isopropylmalate dehydratase small subunit